MLDLTNYDYINSAQSSSNKVINDLVAISNLKDNNIDEVIVSITDTTVTINGDKTIYDGRYVVLGHEIAYIDSSSFNGTNTTLTLIREQYGTKKDSIDLTNHYIRTVDIFTNVQKWKYNSYIDNKTQPFPFSLETGSVTLLESMNNWGYDKEYYLKRKNSAVYLFKGFGKQRILKYTGFGYNTKSRSASVNRPETVTINFNDKFIKWFKKKIYEIRKIKNAEPIDVFKNTLGYDLVKYKNGNISDDFNITNYLFTNEFDTYGDMFKEYAKTGLRFHFNELEEIEITTDLDPSNLEPTEINVTNTNLLDIYKGDEEGYVINKVTGTYYERSPLYDFNALDNNYVNFRKRLYIDEFTLINSDDEFNTITIDDPFLPVYTTQGSLVTLVDELTGIEIHGKVYSFEDGAKNTLTTVIFTGEDKDSWLDFKGRVNYLKTQGFNSPRAFNLWYQRDELPMIYKQQLNNSEGKISSRLNLPLRPQVEGQTNVNGLITKAEFGSPQDLNTGTYTGQYEEIDNIYGTFSTELGNLTYNRELTQFGDPDNYPPIFALSNRVTSDLGRGDDALLSFDKFDNSELEIDISPPDEKDYNARILYKNKQTIQETDLYTLEQSSMTQLTPSLFEITSTQYANISVGDVIAIKEPATFVDSEQRSEYNNNNQTNWIIERAYQESGTYYMELNGSIRDTFDFTVYPATSIVYLQEFYILGNPVIEYLSPFTNTSQDSIDRYDEQEQTIDGRMLNLDGVAKLVDYYDRGFNALTEDSKKYILPLKIRNHIELQKYDIITITDTIYTKYDSNTKFIILGLEESDATKGNSITYYVMNINDFIATETNFNVEKMLSFKPINDVTYNSTGNEGSTTQDKQDKTNPEMITAVDNKYGSISLRPLKFSDIEAIVNTLTDGVLSINNITIDNSDYVEFLSVVDDFRIIAVDGEFLLVKIQSYDSGAGTADLTVIKRPFFEGTISTATNIAQTKRVKFYEITSGSIGGDLITQNLLAGNKDDYIKFKQGTGTEIKSTSDVNISNANNVLEFDGATDKSSLKLNKSDSYYQQQLGSDLEDSEDNGVNSYDGAFIGDPILANNNYLKYDGTLTLKGSADISGGSINISSNNSLIQFDSDNSIIELNNTGGSSTAYMEINQPTDNNYFLFGKANTVIKSNDITMTGGAITLSATDSVDINTSDFNLTTDGDVSITNANNSLIFDSTGGTGSLKMNYDGAYYRQQIGNGLVDSSEIFNGLIVGNADLTQGQYIKYNGSLFSFGENVNIAGVITTGDTLVVEDVSANEVVKYGELTSGVFGFDFTSPSISGEYFRLADNSGGTDPVYSQGLQMKTSGSVEIGLTDTGTFQVGDLNDYIKWEDGTLNISGNVNITGGNASVVISQDTAPTLTTHPNLKNGDIWIDTSSDERVQYVATDVDLYNLNQVYGDGTYGNGIYGTGIWKLVSTNNNSKLTYANLKIGEDAVGAGQHGFNVDTTGWVNINNDNNQIYFTPESTLTSFIDLAKDGNGRFQIGDTTSSQYMKYEDGILNVNASVNITGGTGISNLTDAGSLAVEDSVDFSTSQVTNQGDLPIMAEVPAGEGLFLNSSNMGYYKDEVWNAYIGNDGSFAFNGDGSNAITYDGIDFNITSDSINMSGGSINLSTATDTIQLNENDTSYLSLNSGKIKLGDNAISTGNDGLYLSDDTSTNIFSFDVTSGDFSLASDDITMTGGKISLTASDSVSISTNDFSLKTTGDLEINDNSEGIVYKTPNVKTVSSIDSSTNTITSNSHNYSDGDLIKFTTTGTFPSGISSEGKYYIYNKTSDTYQIVKKYDSTTPLGLSNSWSGDLESERINSINLKDRSSFVFTGSNWFLTDVGGYGTGYNPNGYSGVDIRNNSNGHSFRLYDEVFVITPTRTDTLGSVINTAYSTLTQEISTSFSGPPAPRTYNCKITHEDSSSNILNIGVDGLTVGSEPTNPINGSFRINSGSLQVYLSGSWLTVQTS